MLKSMIEKIVAIGGPEKFTDQHGEQWARLDYRKIMPAAVEHISTTTLEGIVDYIDSEIDNPPDEKMILQIENFDMVAVLSGLKTASRVRDRFIEASYIKPQYLKNYQFGFYYPIDAMKVWLLSGFVDNDDKEAMLRFLGSIKDSKVNEVGDDGISQAVQTKVGITVENVMLPSELNLAPFRTFPEVTQPESKFKLRMKSGAGGTALPTAALFEADGGKWEVTAVESIVKYFKEADLPKNVTIIA